MTGAELAQFVSDYGLITLVPLAIIEGPIITIIAAYLARMSLIDPVGVFACAILGDLIGDVLLYWLGRSVPGDALVWLSPRLRVRRRVIAPLVRAMRRQGARILVVGKLTHAAGFAGLLAAGAARMDIRLFLIANMIATVPKTLVLMGVGYAFGGIGERLNSWMEFGSVAVFAALVAVGLIVFFIVRWRRKCPG